MNPANIKALKAYLAGQLPFGDRGRLARRLAVGNDTQEYRTPVALPRLLAGETPYVILGAAGEEDREARLN